MILEENVARPAASLLTIWRLTRSPGFWQGGMIGLGLALGPPFREGNPCWVRDETV